MNKHPVAWFYLLAFGLAWLGWIPIAIGSHGIAPFNNPNFQFLLLLPALSPALAAVIVTQARQGRAAVHELLGGLLQWRVSLPWYLVALLGPVVLLASGQFLTQWLGLPVEGTAPQGELFPLLLSVLVLSLISNPWEEVGWRGFALPHLQKRYTALVSSLVVGVLWGLWHLPLFFWAGNPIASYPFLPWLISLVAGSILYAWLYNSTRGSLLPVSLFHLVRNTVVVLFPAVSVTALALVSVLAALLLVVLFGGTHLSRQDRVLASER